VNIIVITGRLGRDPETKRSPEGNLWACVPVAEGGDDPNWFDVRAFGRTAERLYQYGSKGRLVGILGRMVQDQYATRNGEKRTTWWLLASRIEFLDSRGNSSDDVEDDPGKPD
jgi:single-strand DNA-binding protein